MKVKIHENSPIFFGKEIFTREVASRLEAKTPLINEILRVLHDQGLIGSEEEMQVRLVLDETIINAIKHGNGLDERKVVQVSIRREGRRWGIHIVDQGGGFTPEDVPDVNDPASLLLERGRGVLLIHEFMDLVWYHARGSSVWLVKERPVLMVRATGRIRRFVRRLIGRR